MQGQKKPSDVLGVKNNCPNYSKCPLCYGCRNVDSSKYECTLCLKDKNTNICKTDVHRADLLGKFIGKTSLDINEEIEF